MPSPYPSYPTTVDISECLHCRYGFVSVSLQNIDPMQSEAIALRKGGDDIHQLQRPRRGKRMLDFRQFPLRARTSQVAQ